MKNQCDGCRRGLPFKGQNHVDKNGRIVMGCAQHLYAETTSDLLSEEYNIAPPRDKKTKSVRKADKSMGITERPD